MLLGTYRGNISPKRRVAIPASFRKELGDKFIVTKWYEICLVLVSTGNWNALLDRLKGESNLITQGIRDTDRFILGSAYELIPDGQGRVVLPAALVSYAGLKNQASFIGLGDRVEIWDKEAWEKREEFVARKAAELIEKLANEK
ncbi:MAG: cell division/cell wall cluster transcriptional repressor MraZ [Patescibacteria group bacterium]